MSGTQSNRPKHKSPKGYEISVPECEDFLRDLKEAAKVKA